MTGSRTWSVKPKDTDLGIGREGRPGEVILVGKVTLGKNGPR